MGVDAARLERVLAAVEPADALWLAELVEPRWKARARRLERRGALVRAAVEATPAPNGTAAAAALARRLMQAASPSRGWEPDREALSILECCDGRRPISASTIADLCGRRGPEAS